MDGALTRHRVVAPARTAALDWIRGIAMALVLLSHGWALWSTAGLERVPPLLHLLQSGNLAVTVFLVVGGFLLVRSLIGPAGLADDDAGRVGTIAADRPGRAVFSRYVRVSAQVYVLLAAVLVLALVDDKEVLTLQQTWASVVAVATYTWNIYLQTNSPVARPDLGHLWYTAVYLQVTVLLVVLVRSLRHRRVVLLSVIGGLLLACTLWRAHVDRHRGCLPGAAAHDHPDGRHAVGRRRGPRLAVAAVDARPREHAGRLVAGRVRRPAPRDGQLDELPGLGRGRGQPRDRRLPRGDALAGAPPGLVAGDLLATDGGAGPVLTGGLRVALPDLLRRRAGTAAAGRHRSRCSSPPRCSSAAVVLTTRYVERPLVGALARRWRGDPPASAADRLRADASAG